MKRFSIFGLTGLVTAVFVFGTGCDALKNMVGGRTEERKADGVSSDQPADQKLKELEEKMKKMEDEAKVRIEAENKANMEVELKAKLEQEIRAKIEAEQKVVATQPVTQPTQKVVERIIVRDAPKTTASEAPARLSGYIHVYTDSQLSGKNMRLSFGQNMHTTDGTAFKDNITSFSYQIPAGWQVSLYQDTGYSNTSYVVKGTGSLGHLPGYMNDKCSSIRWERE